MSKIVFLIWVLLFICTGAKAEIFAQEFYYTTDVKVFREGRDKEFRDEKESPLTKEEFKVFKELNYFPVNSNFRVKARLVKTPDEKPFEAETSSGKTRSLVKYGYFELTLNKKKQKLSVYQVFIPADSPDYEENKNSLFLPFKDLTNTKETYGGGRYISLRIPKTEKTFIDFNLAYNPSCAYNKIYSCFLVPRQNRLAVEIKAGEKLYQKLSEQKSTK